MTIPAYIRDAQPKVEDVSAYAVEAVLDMVRAGKLDVARVLAHERANRKREELIQQLVKDQATP